MNVLYISNMYPTEQNPYFGVFVKKQVDSLRGKGIDVRVACIGREFGGYRKIFSLNNDAEWADILHCHFGHTGTVALYWKLMKQKPLVISYCGSDLFGNVGEDRRYHYKGRILASLNSLFSRFADFAIVKSTGLAKRVKSKHVAVIPNGVDTALFREGDQGQAKERLGLSGYRGKIILFLGQRNNPVKNFGLFKEALGHLDFEYKFLVLENIPYEEVAWVLNASDVCVLASFHEGSPNVIKEAMSCNRPIVSVDVGDVKELLGQIPGCFVVSRDSRQIAQGIKKALAYKKSQGRNRLHDLGLDLEATAARIIDIYQMVLNR